MQCSERNLSMMMDLYEMTMAYGYFTDGLENMKRATFDIFYRHNSVQ